MASLEGSWGVRVKTVKHMHPSSPRRDFQKFTTGCEICTIDICARSRVGGFALQAYFHE